MPGLERLDEVLRDHEVAPAAVGEVRARPHRAKEPRVREAARLGVLGRKATTTSASGRSAGRSSIVPIRSKGALASTGVRLTPVTRAPSADARSAKCVPMSPAPSTRTLEPRSVVTLPSSVQVWACWSS